MSRTTRRMYCGKRRRRKSPLKFAGNILQIDSPMDGIRRKARELAGRKGMLGGLNRALDRELSDDGATLDPTVVRPRPTPPPYLSEGGDTGSGFSGDGTYTITKV